MNLMAVLIAVLNLPVELMGLVNLMAVFLAVLNLLVELMGW